MTQEFLPYERAVKLKQLGFDEPCFGYYIELVKPVEGILTIEKCDKNIDGCLAPTFSQAFRWFREKYDIHYSIDRECSQQDHKWGYNWSLYNYTGLFNEFLTSNPYAPAGEWVYETYEEAELACLDKLIEIVEISKQDEKICTCVDGVITCPGCDGEKESEFGVCAGCNGNGEVTCGKCAGKSKP